MVPDLVSDSFNGMGAVQSQQIQPINLVVQSVSQGEGAHDLVGSSSTAGWAVSGFYGYLKGVNNEMAEKYLPNIPPRNDSLAGPEGRRSDQVCPFLNPVAHLGF